MDCGLHRIDNEIRDGWLEEWVDEGVEQIETFLAKHAAFLAFLEHRA